MSQLRLSHYFCYTVSLLCIFAGTTLNSCAYAKDFTGDSETDSNSQCNISAKIGSPSYCAEWYTVVHMALKWNTNETDLIEIRNFISEIVDRCGGRSTISLLLAANGLGTQGILKQKNCTTADSDCVQRLMNEVSLTNYNTSMPNNDGANVGELLMESFMHLTDFVASIDSSRIDAGVAFFITNVGCYDIEWMLQYESDYDEAYYAKKLLEEKFLLHHINILCRFNQGCEGTTNIQGVRLIRQGHLLENVDEFRVCLSSMSDDKQSTSPTTTDSATTSKDAVSSSKRNSKKAIVLAVAVVASIVGVALILAVLYWVTCARRRRFNSLERLYAKKTAELLRESQTKPKATPATSFAREAAVAKTSPNYARHSADVDDSSCQNTDTWEMAEDDLIVRKDILLGKGTFSVVYRGFLKTQNSMPLALRNPGFGSTWESQSFFQVAVKILREGVEENARRDFVEEIDFLKQLGEHPHVLSLVGCVTKCGTRPMIVTEYCSKGDLHTFLRARRLEKSAEPDHHQQMSKSLLKLLTSLAWQIADGMNFLSAKQLVHRSLTAHCVLLTDLLSAKISDLGMCQASKVHPRSIDDTLLPIRWMAPESLRNREFTTESDVWSYGVLLFEVFSLGETPFADLEGSAIAPYLASERRLPQPNKCPDAIYALMSNCWYENPDRRPRFAQLRAEFEAMLSASDAGYGYLLVK